LENPVTRLVRRLAVGSLDQPEEIDFGVLPLDWAPESGTRVYPRASQSRRLTQPRVSKPGSLTVSIPLL
jgi:hypothetical protein